MNHHMTVSPINSGSNTSSLGLFPRVSAKFLEAISIGASLFVTPTSLTVRVFRADIPILVCTLNADLYSDPSPLIMYGGEMVGLLSLPDELITHILVLGGHLTIVACQQARTFLAR